MLPIDINKTLKSRVTFQGGLKLNRVKTSERDQFFGNLALRVYTLRNAIVHSKKDIDRTKGRVSLKETDLHSVHKEAMIVRYFALEVVSRACLSDD